MVTSEVSPNAKLIVVRCRQSGLGWFMVVLTSLYGGFCLAAPFVFPNTSQPPAPLVFLALGLLILIPTLVFAVYLLRAEIVADDMRLYIRGLRGYQSIGWDEVTDYYEKRLAKGQPAIVIVSPHKTWIWPGAAWNNLSALRECVQQRATRAFAHAWAERGDRPDEPWPLIFDYNTPDNRTMPRILGVSGVLLIVCYIMMGLRIAEKFPHTVSEMGWGWTLGMLACGGAVLLIPFALILVHVSNIRETYRRRNQRIVVTHEGLTFEERELRITTPWEEITEYFSLPQKGLLTVFCQVVASKQGVFDFTGSIGECRLLLRLIERYASEAAARGRQKYPGEEDLLKSTLPANSGEQIYHYRARSLRAIFWFLLTFAEMPLISLFLASQGLVASRTNNTTVMITLAVMLNVAVLWAYWWYRATSVHTDAQGITLYTPFGKRTISWGDVQEYYISGSEGSRVVHILGSQTRIRFWLGILRSETLKTEIRARATHSRTTKWEHRSK